MELWLLAPASRVISRFRASTPKRLLASLPFHRPATAGACGVILHRSVYCPPRECSNFCLGINTVLRLLRWRFAPPAQPSLTARGSFSGLSSGALTGSFTSPRQVVDPSAPSWIKSISRYSIVRPPAAKPRSTLDISYCCCRGKDINCKLYNLRFDGRLRSLVAGIGDGSADLSILPPIVLIRYHFPFSTKCLR